MNTYQHERGACPPKITALAAAIAVCAACLALGFAAGAQAASPRAAAKTPAPVAAPLAVAVAAPAPARAQPAAPDNALQRWVEESAAASWSSRLASPDGSDSGVRFEVRLGQLNPGLKLAACSRFEPFLPPNARLWGRAFIGVRCVEGASWTTMLPVTVSVFGQALVANLPLSLGTMARLEDFRLEEVDLTTTQGQPVTDPAWLEGRAIGRPLQAGQVLRATDLRTPQTVAAGDPVRIRLMGQGFTITTEGFAMAGAGNGQPLRVRTQTGKVLVGTVRERSVEVRL
jgi:flagella basal body P-ring formation protein FlgA